MRARVKWVEDRTFVGESGTGHRIVLGAAHGPEGRTPGPSAMELVLISLGDDRQDRRDNARLRGCRDGRLTGPDELIRPIRLSRYGLSRGT